MMGWAVAFAQGIATAPYHCDFENAMERSQWRMINGSQTNQWHIDTATNCGGNHSLYISDDGGCSYRYTTSAASSVWVCRQIALVAGFYNISYDWKCQGYSNSHYMRAYLVPIAQFNGTAGSSVGFQTSGSPAGWIPINATYPTGALMNNQSACQNVYIGPVSVPTTGTYYIVFGWTNTSYYISNDPYPAAIDNVQITTSTCPRPENLSVRTTSQSGDAEASWTEVGSATAWLLEYSTNPNFRPSRRIIITTPPNNNIVTYNNLTGFQQSTSYYFRVRSLCDTILGDTSMWSRTYNYRFCSNNIGCIDFTNLHGQGVVCTYGKYQNYQQYSGQYLGPYADTGVVDYGSASYGRSSSDPGSRHTVNTDPNAVDPLFPQIYKIPPGECASVRLGSFYGGYICQSISYQFLVDTSQADILLFKYACVFNDVNHGASQQPRFVLEILDQQGTLINPNCGAADYNATDVTSGNVGGTWYSRTGTITYIDTIQNNGVINCSTITATTYSNGLRGRDWTPLGLNIAQYHGQNLSVRVTSFSCGQSGPNHCGYVYYTLGCAKGRIQSTACGAGNTSTTLTAPSGFSYRWYSARNPNQVLSRQQTITVQVDSTMYYCDVQFVDDTSCHFTLSTFVSNRYPKAMFSGRTSTDSCRYRLQLMNQSRIVTDPSDTTSVGRCESFFWDFGNGQTSTAENPMVEYLYPGTYTVTLIARLNDGECADTISHTFTFNPPVHSHIIAPRRICFGDTAFLRSARGGYLEYRWSTGYTRDSLYVVPDTTTQYTLITRDSIGCIDTMKALVAVINCHIYDTTCRNNAYINYGFNIPSLIQHRDTTVMFERHQQSHFGVDSVTCLFLTVFDTNEMYIYDTFCYGESYKFYDIPITRGGHYTKVFSNIHGCDSVMHLMLEELPRPAVTLWHSNVPCFDYPVTMIADRTGSWIRWASYPTDTSLMGQEDRDTVVVRPHERTIYEAVVGLDGYTCTTTATDIINIEVDLEAKIHTSSRSANFDNMQVIFYDRSEGNTDRRWYLNDFNMPVGTEDSYIYTFDPREDSVRVLLVAMIEGTKCYDTSEVVINLLKDGIWIPNAFTPSEENNGEFVISGIELIHYEIEIYNRQGYKVFETDDINKHWNGHLNNDKSNPIQPGSYAYRVLYKTKTQPDRWFVRVGSVLVIE